MLTDKCEDHDLPVDHDIHCYVESLEMNLMLYDVTLKVLIERNGGSIIVDDREVKPYLDDNKICVPFPVEGTNEVIWKIQEVIFDEEGENPDVHTDDEMRP